MSPRQSLQSRRGEFFPSQGGRRVTAKEDIPFAHKFAICPIPKGAEVRKYGEVIGEASEAIGAGTCGIGAYHQDEVDAILGVDGVEEFTIYVASVGKIEKSID
jgi:altronate dehydratase